MSFSAYALKLVGVFALAFFAGDWMGGLEAGLMCLVAAMSAWVAWQLSQLRRLLQYLERPGLKRLPVGAGVWRRVGELARKREKKSKRRKKRVNEVLMRFYSTVEMMPNGALTLNDKGRIEWMNALALRHLGLSRYWDLRGDLAAIYGDPAFRAFLEEPDAGRESYKLRVEGAADPQNDRVILIHRRDMGGGRRMLFTQDVTQLERVNDVRRDFVSNVSHELKTPWAIINGFLQTMADTPDMERADRRRFIGLALAEGARMQNLLSDLIVLSRIENADREALKKAMSLSGVALKAAKSAQALSAGAHEFALDVEPDLWVFGIESDVYAALSNIVFNAVRYTPKGGKITVSLRRVAPDVIERERLDAPYARPGRKLGAPWPKGEALPAPSFPPSPSPSSASADAGPAPAISSKFSAVSAGERGGALRACAGRAAAGLGRVWAGAAALAARWVGLRAWDLAKNSEGMGAGAPTIDEDLLADEPLLPAGVDAGDVLFAAPGSAEGAWGEADGMAPGPAGESSGACEGAVEGEAEKRGGEWSHGEGVQGEGDQREGDQREGVQGGGEQDAAPEGVCFAEFSCQDTGVGIEKKHIGRLTERFYRVNVAQSRKANGTGLGLAIAKHALGEHHSRLKICSEPNVGSTFSCRFPLTDPPAGLGDGGEADEAVEAVEGAEPGTAAGAKPQAEKDGPGAPRGALG